MRWLAFVAIVPMALEACEKEGETPASDTAVPPVLSPPDTPVASLPPSAWDSRAGLALLVRHPESSGAMVVFPQYSDSTLPDTVRHDPTIVRGMIVDVFNRGGLVGKLRVDSMQALTWTEGCIEWPTAMLSPASPGAIGATWNAAFASGRVKPVPLDSMESLSPVDSARIAVQLTRLASAIPDASSSSFRGLPFVVRSAHRFRAAPAVRAIVADIVRKVNLEANPLEEHTLLIAERDSGDSRGQWKTVYTERVAGMEEHIETTDLLAAVQLPAGEKAESGGGETQQRTALLVARVNDETTAYALIERMPSGIWVVRWTSVTTGC